MKLIPQKLSELKVAFIYDRVNTPFGGAEQVLVALHELFPQAPLFTSVYDPQQAQWAKIFEVRTSFLQQFSWAKKMHRWLVALMPLAFEALDLSEFDLVISITSAEAKGVLTKPDQLHICYLLTPTRYLWSHATEYEQDWFTGWLRRPVFRYLRWWDQAAALRPDVMIPISELVAQRCREYYLREPEKVIYPTVGITSKTTQMETEDSPLPADLQKLKGNYFLIVARLVPYKKIDLAIQACQKAGKNLVIIGEGPDKHRLQTLVANGHATAKIFFLQAVQVHQLPAYYQYCRAFLAPAAEDFGMTVLEAQHFGKPVIAFSKSGGAEVIQEGENGLYFFEQTVDDLSEALHIVEQLPWEEAKIKKMAAKYSQENFRQGFYQAVECQWEKFRTQHKLKGHYVKS